VHVRKVGLSYENLERFMSVLVYVDDAAHVRKFDLRYDRLERSMSVVV
jgi:hypothetical protein